MLLNQAKTMNILPSTSVAAATMLTTTTAMDVPHRPTHHSFFRMLQTQNNNNNGGRSNAGSDSTASTSTQTKSCAPPPPQNTSHVNPNTNETMYYVTEVEVHEIGMIYYYEIHHAEGVSWEETGSGSGSNNGGGRSSTSVSGTIGDWIDTAQNFFGGLFDDNSSNGQQQQSEVSDGEGDTEESSNSKTIGGGNANLTRLEKYMVTKVWKDALNDERMTWSTTYTADDDDNDDDDTDTDDGEKKECAGLVIDDETTSATVEDEITKLLGLTHEPLDYVNPDGCTVPDPTCTSILGQVSVAYSGPNEYGVIQHVIEQIKVGMEDGSFIPQNSPALALEFLKAGDAAPVSESGEVISLTTARGMEEPMNGNNNEEISRYGVLFVCFVAVLGTGFIAAMVFRYKKRQHRRSKGADFRAEGGPEATSSPVGDRDVTFPTVQEPSSAVNDDVSDLESSTRSDSTGITNRVELMEIPAVDSGAENQDVEMSYTPRIKKSRRRRLDIFGREG